jgi:hypothetical protein
MYPTHYRAKQPPRGLHWVYRDRDGSWHRLEPPADWGAPEGWDDAPPLVENFFLSAPEAAWSTFDDKPWQKGVLRSEPELYAKLASSDVSPGSMLKYANSYGFLGPKVDRHPIEKNLWPEYSSEPGFDLSQGGYFWAEAAYEWQNVLGGLSNAINIMEKMPSASKSKQAGFVSWYNMHTERGLDYWVEYDAATAKLKGEVVASSLADFLMVQLVSAAEADIRHRRCEQCQTFFQVHPGLGRPEKKFCSDACRMRAYRQRLAEQKGGTVK